MRSDAGGELASVSVLVIWMVAKAFAAMRLAGLRFET